MKQSKKFIIAGILSGTILTSTTSVMAGELTVDDSQVEENTTSKAGGYFKVGLGYRFVQSPYSEEISGLSLFLSGRYQWQNGLFVEQPGANNKLEPGARIGYNFYNTENWDFDLIASVTHGSLIYDVMENDQHVHIETKVSPRLGIRSRGYFGDNTVQFTVMPYSSNTDYDQGVYASAWAGRHWQVKNWNFHASAGIQYRSKSIMDYYYGVPEDVATENTPAYEAGSGFNVTGQLGATYPINKSWVFESYLRYTDLADAMTNSPQLQNSIKYDSSRSENRSEVGILVNYVF